MQMLKRFSVVGLLLVMVAVPSVASAGGQPTPFRTTYSGEFDPPTVIGFQPLTVFITTRTTGVATHLGNFTGVFPHEVNMDAGTFHGRYTMTAANGDELHIDLIGNAVPLSDTEHQLRFEGTIVGGTGRFVNATGSVTGEGIANLASLTVQVQLDGFIIKN